MTAVTREAGFAAALVDPSLPVPSGVVSPRGDSDAKRFAVYRNNVHVGLVGVVVAKYPVCARLVGEAFFTAMARQYVAARKPTSPIMMHYASDFAEFVASYEAARPVPYLADVALLEQAWSVAYNARDEQPMRTEQLVEFVSEDLGEVRLEVHPAVTLVRSKHPIGSIWSAHHAEGVPVRSGAEAVLVSRPAAEVMVTVVPPVDAAFCGELLGGATIASATAHALERHPDFDFGRALVGLCSIGAFSASPRKDGPHAR